MYACIFLLSTSLFSSYCRYIILSHSIAKLHDSSSLIFLMMLFILPFLGNSMTNIWSYDNNDNSSNNNNNGNDSNNGHNSNNSNTNSNNNNSNNNLNNVAIRCSQFINKHPLEILKWLINNNITTGLEGVYEGGNGGEKGCGMEYGKGENKGARRVVKVIKSYHCGSVLIRRICVRGE